MRDIDARSLNELPLGADSLKEHDELKFEDDHRIDGWSAMMGVPLRDPIPRDRQVKGSGKLPREVVVRDELLEGNGNWSVEGATFGWTDHEGHPWEYELRGQCFSQHTPTAHFFTASAPL